MVEGFLAEELAGIPVAVLAKCISTQAMARVPYRNNRIEVNATIGHSSRPALIPQIPKFLGVHRQLPAVRKAAFFAERPVERAWERSVARSEETAQKARPSARRRADCSAR
jgi:hypothetical protein